MILSDYAPRKRHDILWQALDNVLSGLKCDHSTQQIAELLQIELNAPLHERRLVMTWLKKVAPRVPEAQQTGPVVKAYGNYGRRWIWSPRRAGPSVAVAVDDSDW